MAEASFITNRDDEGIVFGCEINGKTVYFLPVHLIADEEIYTHAVALSEEILNCTEDEARGVKRLYEEKRALVQLYFNVTRNAFSYPYPKQSLYMLLALDLSDSENAIVQSYLNQITFIYLIRDRLTGFTKIGRSRTPEERLSKLRKQDTLMPQKK